MRNFLFSFLALLVIFSLFFHARAGGAGHLLELLDTDTGESVYTVSVLENSLFTLRYIHSVEKTPVFETYRVTENGDIHLEETSVKSSGYGLPEGNSKGRSSFENGWLHIKDLNQRIPLLVFRVSYLNDMLLIFEDHCVNLAEIAGRGHRIKVRILEDRRSDSAREHK